MSENVAQTLETNSVGLYQKLAQNEDVSNVIMALLTRIIVMCRQWGKPIQGVSFGNVNESDGEIRFGMSFSNLALPAMDLWQPQENIAKYGESKAARLAKVIEGNPRLLKVFGDVVNIAEKMCERKGKQFKDFQIKKAFIHPKTNVCVIRSGAPELSDRFR